MVRRSICATGAISELVMETILTMPDRAISRLSSDSLARPRCLSRLACQALIAEAELTPKPGLVDRRGPGSHTDLSLPLMRQSAAVIEPYFREMASISIETEPDRELRENLGAIGRKAERAMYAATGGSNSHKGAIWSLGLLVSAAAMQGDVHASFIAEDAGAIASHEDRCASAKESHGRLMATRYRATGARGEAASGFPHVMKLGLPILRAKRLAGVPEDFARLDSLLSIMSKLADTCVLYRGGRAALFAVQHGATEVIEAGGCGTSAGWRSFQQLDVRLRVLGISPGGSADLLAATLFLDAVERRKTAVYADQPQMETHDGND